MASSIDLVAAVDAALDPLAANRDAVRRDLVRGVVLPLVLRRLLRAKWVQFELQRAGTRVPPSSAADWDIDEALGRSEKVQKVRDAVLDRLHPNGDKLTSLLRNARRSVEAPAQEGLLKKALTKRVDLEIRGRFNQISLLTSYHKNIERALRAAKARGEIEELVVIVTEDLAGWEAAVAVAVSQRIIGTPIAMGMTTHGERLIFTTESRNNRGSIIGVKRAERWLGAPGSLLAPIRAASDPMLALAKIERADAARCEERAKSMGELSTSKGPPRGETVLPIDSTSAFLVHLVAKLDGIALRPHVIAAVRACCRPRGKRRFLNTLEASAVLRRRRGRGSLDD